MAITRLNSARDFCRIWFFWKRQAVGLFVLIVGLTMCYAFGATPKYESTAQILVLPKTNEGEVISTGSSEKVVLPVTPQDIYTEIDLLGSKEVMRETVKSFGPNGIGDEGTHSLFGLASWPLRVVGQGLGRLLRFGRPAASELSQQADSLKRACRIEPSVDSSVINIAFRSADPAKAEAILARILEVYMRHRTSVYTKKEGLSFYDEQAKDYKGKLDQAEKDLNAFQQQEDIVNIQSQNQSNIDLLTKLKNEQKLLEISYDESANRITMLKQRILSDSKDIDGNLTKEMQQIPAVIELNKGIVPLLIKQSEISQTFTETSREYTDVNNQITMLRGAIRNEIEKAIKSDEIELESQKIKIDALRQQIERLRAEAVDFVQKDKHLKELQRQVQVYQDSYLLYIKKADDARILSQKTNRDLGNVSISTPPALPEEPVAPKRLLLLVSSLLGGLFAALCLPFILESIDNKLKTADDIERLLELPVVGVFSEIND